MWLKAGAAKEYDVYHDLIPRSWIGVIAANRCSMVKVGFDSALAPGRKGAVH